MALKVQADIIKFSDNTVQIFSDTDTVPYTTPYRVYLFIVTELSGVYEGMFNYITISTGDLIIETDRELWELNFDLNDDGELIVIGEDADNYSVDENGDLIYLITGGIGDMEIENTFIVY